MKQTFELNKNVFIFRADAQGNTEIGTGKVVSAEINAAGYIQYGVLVDKNVWQGTLASVGFSKEEVESKVEKYKQLTIENRKRYEEVFGKPEFSEMELKNGD